MLNVNVHGAVWWAEQIMFEMTLYHSVAMDSFVPYGKIVRKSALLIVFRFPAM